MRWVSTRDQNPDAVSEFMRPHSLLGFRADPSALLFGGVTSCCFMNDSVSSSNCFLWNKQNSNAPMWQCAPVTINLSLHSTVRARGLIAVANDRLCRPHTAANDRLYRPHTDCLYRTHINHIPTIYQPPTAGRYVVGSRTDHIATTYQPHADHIQTTYRLHHTTNQMPATYQSHNNQTRSTCLQFPSKTTSTARGSPPARNGGLLNMPSFVRILYNSYETLSTVQWCTKALRPLWDVQRTRWGKRKMIKEPLVRRAKTGDISWTWVLPLRTIARLEIGGTI